VHSLFSVVLSSGDCSGRIKMQKQEILHYAGAQLMDARCFQIELEAVVRFQVLQVFDHISAWRVHALDFGLHLS
jgi:hypothetical protein